MYSKLSDFPSTHWDERNKVLTHYVKLSDRTVTVAYFDDGDCYVICMNNINYDITFEDIDHKLYCYIGWDATLLLDSCVEDIDEAMDIANRYISMKNIPVIHPEYADPMAR